MACQMYLEREDLKKKYNFPIIAYMRMNSAVSNYFKAKNCQCRKSEHGTVSLEQLSDPESGTGKEPEAENLDTLEKIIQSEQDKFYGKYLCCCYRIRQGKIVLYLMDGYKEREIYKLLGIGRKIYQIRYRKRVRDVTLENLVITGKT